MSRELRDRFNNVVHLGDKVVYGANRGLVIGVVVKWNPSTFQIKSTEDGSERGTITNIPYSYKFSLAKLDSLTNLNTDVLTIQEKERIDLDRQLRLN